MSEWRLLWLCKCKWKMLPTAFRPIFPLILDSCHAGSCFDVNFSRAPTLLAINVDYSREILQFHRISTQLSCPSPLLCATQQNMPRSTLKANKKLNFACFAKWSKMSGVGGLFILTFSLQSNRSRWVVMKRKISALQSNLACCRYLHPAELFLPFVKMWQRLLFCAALPRHPPHSGTNPSDGSTAAKIRAFIRFYINTQGGAQLALINSREF